MKRVLFIAAMIGSSAVVLAMDGTNHPGAFPGSAGSAEFDATNKAWRTWGASTNRTRASSTNFPSGSDVTNSPSGTDTNFPSGSLTNRPGMMPIRPSTPPVQNP